jgi:hypothetical protein
VHRVPSFWTSVSSLAKPQVPETHTAFLQSAAGPWGQSAALLQPTHAPWPLQTPPAHAAPAAMLDWDGLPFAQIPCVQELADAGTSELSATKPQVPDSHTAFWQSPAGPCGQSAAVVQLGLVQPDMS